MGNIFPLCFALGLSRQGQFTGCVFMWIFNSISCVSFCFLVQLAPSEENEGFNHNTLYIFCTFFPPKELKWLHTEFLTDQERSLKNWLFTGAEPGGAAAGNREAGSVPVCALAPHRLEPASSNGWGGPAATPALRKLGGNILKKKERKKSLR